MQTLSKLKAEINARTSTESGQTIIETLLGIMLFLGLAVGATVVTVETNDIHADVVDRVASTSGDLNAIEAINRDFAYGEVTSVTADRLQGFSHAGIQVTYEVNSEGKLVRIDGMGARAITEAPQNFSFQREGNQVHYQLKTIASAVTPGTIY